MLKDHRILIIAAVALVGLAVLGWLVFESSKPLPGEKVESDCNDYFDFSKLEGLKGTEDKCRVHVPAGSVVNYKTNPPVFGPHFEDWIRAGVQDSGKDDRNLVHSLEHGYVIMSYRCFTGAVSSEASGSAEATSSGKIDTQDECNKRKSEFEEIFNKKGKRKLIVVPRANLDTNYALTAWGYLDKFNEFDESRVNKFIDAHLDNGPERTME